jgi:hypothetical protein
VDRVTWPQRAIQQEKCAQGAGTPSSAGRNSCALATCYFSCLYRGSGSVHQRLTHYMSCHWRLLQLLGSKGINHYVQPQHLLIALFCHSLSPHLELTRMVHTCLLEMALSETPIQSFWPIFMSCAAGFLRRWLTGTTLPGLSAQTLPLKLLWIALLTSQSLALLLQRRSAL